MPLNQPHTEQAVFAGGCFWCTEAIFQMLKGVESVTSGYTGGRTVNPTYEQICETDTGHTEAVKIVYDPSVISYDDLLAVFFNIHNPTTVNQQGGDIGPQYRSAIFYTGDEQMNKAVSTIKELDSAHAYDKPIVTEVSPLGPFYPAEADHKDYYKNNTNQPYCQAVIAPKLAKMQKRFAKLLRSNS